MPRNTPLTPIEQLLINDLNALIDDFNKLMKTIQTKISIGWSDKDLAISKEVLAQIDAYTQNFSSHNEPKMRKNFDNAVKALLTIKANWQQDRMSKAVVGGFIDRIVKDLSNVEDLRREVNAPRYAKSKIRITVMNALEDIVKAFANLIKFAFTGSKRALNGAKTALNNAAEAIKKLKPMHGLTRKTHIFSNEHQYNPPITTTIVGENGQKSKPKKSGPWENA